MDPNRRKRNEMAAQRVIKGLESRNMEGYYAESKEEALKKAGRTDLIGYGRHCLIRPEKGDAAYRPPAQKAASGPGKPARPAKKKTIRNIHKKKNP